MTVPAMPFIFKFNVSRRAAFGARTPIIAAALIAIATFAAPAAAGLTTYVETFDDGMNNTAWTWDRTPLGTIQPTGGNPASGGYFQSALMSVPALFSSHATFTGDFRERAVGSIGGDLSTVQFASPAGDISVSLRHDNGTPANLFDDTFASFVTSIAAPVNPSFGWVSFVVAIPFESLITPAGWTLGGIVPQLPPTVDWNTLITSVDEVIISWSDPSQPTLLFDVVRGADNLSITYNVPAPATLALTMLALAAGRRRRRG